MNRGQSSPLSQERGHSEEGDSSERNVSFFSMRSVLLDHLIRTGAPASARREKDPFFFLSEKGLPARPSVLDG